jgi:hypothetical protein
LVDKYEDKKLESCDQTCQIAAGEKTLDLYQKFHDKFQSDGDERIKKLLASNDRQITNVKGKLDLIKLKAPEVAPAPSASASSGPAPATSAPPAASASHS